MTVRNLSDVPFEIIVDCFIKAFENYFVKMPSDRASYKKQWKTAEVDFSCSYGMFEGEKMIGFIIHVIDKRNGRLIAFNTGTGVLPAYRGRRIVNSIYSHALNDLTKKNIESSTLEVITKNEIAIKVYEGIGFKKCREYKCFNGEIEIDTDYEFDLEEVDLKNVDWDRLPNQDSYSWDNQKESLMKGNYRFFNVNFNDRPESFFVINPEINYLAQFDLLNIESKGWGRLFAAIKTISEIVKINNVDCRLKEKQEAVVAFGLKNTVDQFEMEIKINNSKEKSAYSNG